MNASSSLVYSLVSIITTDCKGASGHEYPLFDIGYLVIGENNLILLSDPHIPAKER